jgi:phosphate uptake regulator
VVSKLQFPVFSKLGEQLSNITEQVNAVGDSVGNSVDAIRQLDSQLGILTRTVENFSQASKNIDMTSELQNYLNILSQISATYKDQIDQIKQMKPDSLLVDPDKEIEKIRELTDKARGLFSSLGQDLASCFNLHDIIQQQIASLADPQLQQAFRRVSEQVAQMFGAIPTDAITKDLKKIADEAANVANQFRTISENPIKVKVENENLEELIRMTQNFFSSHRESSAAMEDMGNVVKGSTTTIKTEMEEVTKQTHNWANSVERLNEMKSIITSFQTDLYGLDQTFKELSNSSAMVYDKLRALGNIDLSSAARQAYDIQASMIAFQNQLRQVQMGAGEKEGLNFTDPNKIVGQFQNLNTAGNQAFKTFQGTYFGEINNQDLSKGFSSQELLVGYESQIKQILEYRSVLEHAKARLMQEQQNTTDPQKIQEYKNAIGDMDKFILGAYHSESSMRKNHDKIIDRIGDENRLFSSDLNDYNQPRLERMVNSTLGGRALSDIVSGVDHVSGSARRISNRADHINRDLEVGNYDFRQRFNTRNAVDVDAVSGQAGEVEKQLIDYENKKKKIVEQINKDLATGTEEGHRRAEAGMQKLLDLTEKLQQRGVALGAAIKITNKKDFDKLPDDVKALIREIGQLESSLSSAIGGAVKFAEIFGVDSSKLNAFKNMKEEVDQVTDKVDKLQNKTKSWLDETKEKLGQIFSMQNLAGGLNRMGISGLPIGAGVLGMLAAGANYGLGAFRLQHNMSMSEIDATRAEIGMGNWGTIDQGIATAQNRVRTIGNEQFRMSQGLIGFEDYNKYYTGLARNVGGHYGEDGLQARNDMDQLSRNTFMLAKVHGISDTTMQNSIQAFYKDLRMSATDASYAITSLAQTAMSSNIPVEKYVATVSSLAASLKSIGVSGDVTVNMMNNLTAKGMDLDQAAGITRSTGQAMSNLANNYGMSGYMGLMTGQAGNIWESMWQGVNRTNSDGSMNKNWAGMMSQRLDGVVDMYGMTMADGPQKGWMYYKTLKEMGYSDEQSSMLANAKLEGGGRFEDLIKNTKPGEDKNNALVQSNSKLESQMKKLADQMDPVTRINNEIIASQRDLANKLYELRPELEALRKAISIGLADLGKGLSGIVDIIKAVSHSPAGAATLDFLGNHNPLLLYAGYKGAKWAGGKGLDLLRGGFPSWGGSGSSTPSTAGTGSSGAYRNLLRSGGRVAALAAMAYGAYELFSPSHAEGAAPGGGAVTAERLYGRVDDIYKLLSTGEGRMGHGGMAGLLPSGVSSSQAMGLGLLAAGGYGLYQMNRLPAPISTEVKTVEEAAKEEWSAAGKSRLKSVPGFGARFLGGLKGNALLSLGFGAYDAYSQYSDAKAHGQDPSLGKIAGNVAWDTSFAMAGAALGTALFPGVGTLAGAGIGLAGGMLGNWAGGKLKNMIFNDQDSMKDPDQLEQERAQRQIELMGFSDEQKKKMLEGLEKHADQLKGLSADQKIIWLQILDAMMKQGQTLEAAIRAANSGSGKTNPDGSPRNPSVPERPGVPVSGHLADDAWNDYSVRSAFLKDKQAALRAQAENTSDPEQQAFLNAKANSLEKAIWFLNNPQGIKDQYYEMGLKEAEDNWRVKIGGISKEEYAQRYADQNWAMDNEYAYQAGKEFKDDFKTGVKSGAINLPENVIASTSIKDMKNVNEQQLKEMLKLNDSQSKELKQVQTILGDSSKAETEQLKEIKQVLDKIALNGSGTAPGQFGGTGNPLAPPGNPGEGGNYDIRQNSGVTAQILNQRLGGVLAGKGDVVMQAAAAAGIDPGALAAIMMHESANGDSKFVRELNNPGGLMRTDDSHEGQQFESIDQGIWAVAKNLNAYVRDGDTTLGKIRQSWAPEGASNDPNGQNAAWLGGVSGWMRQLGVNPGPGSTMNVNKVVTGDDDLWPDSEIFKWVKGADGVDLQHVNRRLLTRMAKVARDKQQPITISSGYRSNEQQRETYARVGPGQAAPPGSSRHEIGMASDVRDDWWENLTEEQLAAYGLHRPAFKGTSDWERWHTEMIETKDKSTDELRRIYGDGMNYAAGVGGPKGSNYAANPSAIAAVTGGQKINNLKYSGDVFGDRTLFYNMISPSAMSSYVGGDSNKRIDYVELMKAYGGSKQGWMQPTQKAPYQESMDRRQRMEDQLRKNAKGAYQDSFGLTADGLTNGIYKPTSITDTASSTPDDPNKPVAKGEVLVKVMVEGAVSEHVGEIIEALKNIKTTNSKIQTQVQVLTEQVYKPKY